MSKVRVAFLGCGGFMGAHAGRLKTHPDVEIVALCDVSQDQVRLFCEKHYAGLTPQPQFFTDPAQMYAQVKPDAVFIASPHTLHFDHGVQALDAGCHVYMEKPMVTDLGQAYKLAEKVKQSGKILVVGYNSPCTPEFMYLRQLIQDQTLGKLELVCGYLSQDWMKFTVGKWRQDPKLSGGGQAYDSGAHLLNSLCWSVASDVDQVFAFVDNHGTAVDINSSFTIRFANHVLASIVISGNCPSNAGHLCYIFDKGRVEIDGWNGTWINVWKGGEKVKYPPITADMGFATPDHNFIEAVLGRAQPRTSPRNGIIQSQLMDAIYESARTGQAARPRRG
ncbi:MAG: Gfo/Idh/MocA family oxidoreductase [Phycisphaeraceae bacterium]